MFNSTSFRLAVGLTGLDILCLILNITFMEEFSFGAAGELFFNGVGELFRAVDRPVCAVETTGGDLSDLIGVLRELWIVYR